MYKLRLIFFGLFASVIYLHGASSAYAFVSGQDLLEWSVILEGQNPVKRSDDDQNSAFFMGFVSGAADAYETSSVCPPHDLKLKDKIEVITQHLEANPKFLKLPGIFLIGRALADAYPCPDKSEK